MQARLPRHRRSNRASVRQTTTGPTLAAMPEGDSLVIRPLGEGERPAFERATILADTADKAAITAAGNELAARLERLGAKLPVVIRL